MLQKYTPMNLKRGLSLTQFLRSPSGLINIGYCQKVALNLDTGEIQERLT